MAAPLITSAFARIGDTRNPPQTDATGAVNWDNGYTPNYEINLSSGDPLAKPVERDVMNYLFNILTDNVKQYQALGTPEWYSAMPNGYQAGAVVCVNNGNGWDLYRSLLNQNTSNPVGSASWDKIWTSAQIRGIIPMPLGGPNSIQDGNLPSGGNITSLGNGTYIVPSDAIAATITGLPLARAGVLEIRRYGSSSMYRYTSDDNNAYWTNTTSSSPNVQWNRGISTREIGAEPGYIPRIDNAGLYLTNQGNIDTSVGISNASTRNGARVFINSSSMIAGGIAAGVAATYAGKTALFYIQANQSNVSQPGDVYISDNSGPRMAFLHNVSTTLNYASLFITRAAAGAYPEFQLQSSNGNTSGRFRATANGGIAIGAAQDYLSFNSSGDAFFLTGRAVNATTFNAANYVNVGNTNDGLSFSNNAGQVYFRSNGAAKGYWDKDRLYYPLIKADNLTSYKPSAIGDGLTLISQSPIIHLNEINADGTTLRDLYMILDGQSFRIQYDSTVGTIVPWQYSPITRTSQFDGTITAGTMNTNRINIFDTDSGFSAYSDGQIFVMINNAGHAYFNQTGLIFNYLNSPKQIRFEASEQNLYRITNEQIHIAGQTFVGSNLSNWYWNSVLWGHVRGGSTDSNGFMVVMNGAIILHADYQRVYGRDDRALAYLNEVVTSFRLGAYTTVHSWNGPGFSDTPGWVVTGCVNNNGDEFIDVIQARRTQVYLNGGWVDCGSA